MSKRSCCVVECSNSDPESFQNSQSRLHSFPQDLAIKLQWIEFLDIAGSLKSLSSKQICERHFKESDYKIFRSEEKKVQVLLKRNAIPSIKKPEESKYNETGDSEEDEDPPEKEANTSLEEQLRTLKNEIDGLRQNLESKSDKMETLMQQLEKGSKKSITASVSVDNSQAGTSECPSFDPNTLEPIKSQLKLDDSDDLVEYDDVGIKVEHEDPDMLDNYSSLSFGNYSQAEVENDFEEEEWVEIPSSYQDDQEDEIPDVKRKMRPTKQSDHEKSAKYLKIEEYQEDPLIDENEQSASHSKTTPLVVMYPSDLKNGKRALNSVQMKVDEDSQQVYFVKKMNPEEDTSTSRSIDSNDEGRTFDCQQCPKIFQTEERLTAHLNTHEFDPPIMCACGVSFKRMPKYKQHLRMIHEEDPRVCPICAKVCKNAYKYNLHIKSHEDQKRHVCPFCPKSFVHSHHLKNHINTHTGDRPHKCELCTHSFKQPYALSLHMRKHKKEFFVCERCSAEFVMQKQLIAHLAKCDGVTKRFVRRKANVRSSSDYVKPERSEDAVRDFVCPFEGCDQEFFHKVTVQTHLKNVHSVAVTELTCVHCGKDQPDKLKLRQHVKEHTNVFECDICKTRFKMPEKLANHMKTNHGEDDVRPFECGECQAAFKKAEHLKSHFQLKHTQERNFPCRYCDYRAKLKCDLNAHERRHLKMMNGININDDAKNALFEPGLWK